MSSAITKNAPSCLSSFLMPRGFNMSKKRKSTNDASASHSDCDGTASNGIHTPTISSTTTFFGSEPQKGSRHFVAHVPRIVKTTMAQSVIANRTVEVSRKERAYHKSMPNNAPAVPGPHGQNPLPKPVPIIVGKSGNLFIQWCKINRKILKSKKFSCFF